ncbi:MAG: tRNA uridine-5-carboxymethylaminomethyl(34) synthesis GTPase MnmE [Ignavibacteria bacterium]|jgi:tRNA modification GTPase
MNNNSDTICALATPPGRAGLAVIRISGPSSFAVCDAIFFGASSIAEAPSHRILYGWVRVEDTVIDSVTASTFRGPHSYTGEDVIEIGCHGGAFVTEQIIGALIEKGARYAAAGEFTKRAFLNRKLDLTQVEAVADIIHAETRIGAQTAARQLSGGFTRRLSDIREQLLSVIGLLELELDFSEEDVEFVDRTHLRTLVQSVLDDVDALADTARSADVLRTGFHVAVVGHPNAGKSSLFNALLSRQRAIVSDVAGTTRDYLQEALIIDGYSIHLVDTAGLRQSADMIEVQGISLTASIMNESDLILVINDVSKGAGNSQTLFEALEQEYPNTPKLLVQNKSDLVHSDEIAPGSWVACSAISGTGIDTLKSTLVRLARAHGSSPADVLVNARQAQLLRGIGGSLRACLAGMDQKLSSDLLAVDLRSCIRLLGEISGETWGPDVLDNVFSRFCIGK